MNGPDPDLPPDPVIEAYKKDVDRSLIEAQLRRSIDERVRTMIAALAPVKPYLRGAPAGLPFVFDVATVSRGLNFTLSTTLGDLNLLGDIPGGGTYERLLQGSSELTVLGTTVRVVSLRQLIHLKRAAGRPKDLESIAELELLLEAERSGGADARRPDAAHDARRATTGSTRQARRAGAKAPMSATTASTAATIA